jgi:alpha-glucosidase (family GH31 glycosyl hydrolase)
LAREAFDNGLGPLRPMYYEYPTLDQSYNADMTGKQGQYFYGNDMIISPITSPASNETSYLSNKKWWVPPGAWIEENSHEVFVGKEDGTTFVNKLYALNEIPVLVRQVSGNTLVIVIAAILYNTNTFSNDFFLTSKYF